MDSRQAGEILAYLSSAWPRYELHEETIRVWVDQLRSVDFKAAQDAARRIVAEDDWFPPVARLKALCKPHAAQRRNLGCGNCHRGFIDTGTDGVAICPNCQQNALTDSEAPIAEFPIAVFDWRNGLNKTRKRLGDSHGRYRNADAS